MVATAYDINSPEEQPVALPSAPLVTIDTNIVLQPPLTRRGTGPGIIIFLPDNQKLGFSTGEKPLDPEPVQKWAEEGFAVVAITAANSVEASLKNAVNALLSLEEVDIKDKFGIIVYDPTIFDVVASSLGADSRLVSLTNYGSSSTSITSVPTLLHLITGSSKSASENFTTHIYPASSPYFVLPQVTEYDPGSAALAHSRTLAFLRKCLGGPFFDIEAIWEEHTYFEFEVRSVAKTMGTMVAEPYVNHIPTMAGGIGRKNLTAFYRDHFIFANPADATLQVVSRTVGSDRVVDEFVYHITHDRTVDWLLPGVPPTGKRLAVPMLAVVNVRGDRLYNEHIWWDQATALLQAGVLPTHVPYPAPSGSGTLRLPVAGVECANMLVDESKGKSNEMFGSDWGVQKK
ncbi:NTF2-like protein [Crucibulum laeve]|uniref:NTF2-like protein n=1 Tax=Crucibulum laeve TaxID=68775 RepID=A0A5C3MH86_9AGAR|nr:NTF2-like protein [Crucibulum laeve]